MNYYEAKFKREAKDNPLAWGIIPIMGTGRYDLVYLGEDYVKSN